MLINVLSHHCGKNTNQSNATHPGFFIFKGARREVKCAQQKIMNDNSGVVLITWAVLERKYYTYKSEQLLGYSSI